jgi:uncharacterized delta-60 repeat protein
MIASRKALIVVVAFVLMAIGLPWGGNVPAAFAQTISVTAADPPTGEQGTLNLSVIIKGKGFKTGAKAKWFKTGTTDPAGVNVKSTQYVSSTQLIATIDIADAAALSKFDIQVANADGRTGKGTELFSVLAKRVDPCTLPDPLPMVSGYIAGPPGLSGYLDAAFGAGTGKVIGPRDIMVGSYSGQSAVAIERVTVANGVTEDRIVVAGMYQNSCVSSSTQAWGIARYLPDGSRDASFGSGGLVTITFRGAYASADGVAIQRVVGADGVARNKILVAGRSELTKSSPDTPTVVRLEEDGSLDNTFGVGGVATVPLGRYAGGLHAVAVQSDGKIVAAGFGPGGGLVIRLNPNGTPDSSFNGTGRYSYSPSTSFVAVAVQRVGTEERIVTVGTTETGSTRAGTVWRFTAVGALDATFGTPNPDGVGRSGVATTSFEGFATWFHGVAIDSASRIVAVAELDVSGGNASAGWLTAVVRYDVSGDLDSSFGQDGNGKVVVSDQPWAAGNSVAIEPDDDIVVGGASHNHDAAGNDIDRVSGVWRFTRDGLADSTFGAAGWASDPITSDGQTFFCNGLTLDQNGRIVWAGEVMRGSFRYVALMRLWQ